MSASELYTNPLAVIGGGTHTTMSTTADAEMTNVVSKRKMYDDAINVGGKKFALSTANSYALLQGRDDEIKLTRAGPSTKGQSQKINSKTEVAKNKKAERCPPIAIMNFKRKNVLEMMSELEIKDYHMKLSPNDVNIFVNASADHKKILEHLGKEKGKYEFFSHDLPSDRLFKVVLSGLDMTDIEELREALKEVDIIPEDIKIIRPRQRRRGDDVINHLLYFKAGTVKFEDLQLVRYVAYTKIQWSRYRSIRGRTTQCRNCQMPGHGTKHCGRPTKCMYCAGNHISTQCSEFELAKAAALKKHSEEGKAENEPPTLTFEFKCAQCEGRHRANDPRCPKMIDYQATLDRMARRNRNHHRERMPRLDQAHNAPPQQIGAGRQHGKFVAASYREAVTHGNGSQRNEYEFAHANNLQYNPPPSNPSSNFPRNQSQLFSFEEVQSLLHELLSGLGACKDRAEQFTVITGLAQKYVYGLR